MLLVQSYKSDSKKPTGKAALGASNNIRHELSSQALPNFDSRAMSQQEPAQAHQAQLRKHKSFEFDKPNFLKTPNAA